MYPVRKATLSGGGVNLFTEAVEIPATEPWRSLQGKWFKFRACGRFIYGTLAGQLKGTGYLVFKQVTVLRNNSGTEDKAEEMVIRLERITGVFVL